MMPMMSTLLRLNPGSADATAVLLLHEHRLWKSAAAPGEGRRMEEHVNPAAPARCNWQRKDHCCIDCKAETHYAIHSIASTATFKLTFATAAQTQR